MRILIQLLLISNAAWAAPAELVVYTYDSIVAKGGLGPEIFPDFEKRCGCKIKVVPSGDAGQMLGRLQLDGERSRKVADIVLGLDQNLWPRAKGLVEGWGDWKPAGYAAIAEDLRLEEGFLPYDYGVFAFMADTQALARSGRRIPRGLKELLQPEWKRSILLQDPRTSTPGLAFLLHTRAILSDGWKEYWKSFRPQWLTLAPGWDQAYGLFLKGEAPLVWSYVTSEAYHREHGDADGRYKAVVFEEGHPFQLEGAAMVKRSKLAQDFLEFLLSEQVQAAIPKRNWMMPVRSGLSLPESFRKLPKPARKGGNAESESLLKEWSRIVEGAR